MSSVDVAGVRLHYQEWGGNGERGTAVLVHGLGSTSHIWDLTAPLLAADDVRVIAPDQRGHGLSDQPSAGYDFATVVEDLRGFMEALEIRQPALMVGHSWGASVVLHFAVAHPSRAAGLVLVDGGTGSPGERWDWDETYRRLKPPEIDGLLWSEVRERMSRKNGTYSDPRVEAVGRSLVRVDDDGRITRRFRIPNHMQVVRALWEQRPADLLSRVECPLLVLPARQSSDAPDMAANKRGNVERALQIHPRARVRWYEETIHDVPLQRPQELADELRAFAAEVLLVRSSA